MGAQNGFFEDPRYYSSNPRDRERRLAGGRRSVRRRSVGRRVSKVRVAAGEVRP